MLLLGAAVKMSNAVLGWNKIDFWVFVMGICQYIKACTQRRKATICVYWVLSQQEEKKNNYQIGIIVFGFKYSQKSTLLLPSVTNLEHCCSFVVLDILLFLRLLFRLLLKMFQSSKIILAAALSDWVLYSADSPCSTTSFSPLFTPRAAQHSNSEP